MAVYMIRAGDDGPIKIGSARDPIFRMQSLQISHYLTLQIVRLFEGGPTEEYALHKRFGHLWIRGEWFAASPELMGDVGLPELTLSAVMAKVASRRLSIPPGHDPKIYRSAVSMWRNRSAMLVAPSSFAELYSRLVHECGEVMPLTPLGEHPDD